LQQVALGVVEEKQSGVRVGSDVAERVEEKVATKIRCEQDAFAVLFSHTDETGFPAAVRDIHALRAGVTTRLRGCAVVTLAGRKAPAKVRAFVDFAVERLRSEPVLSGAAFLA
jgi:hypothetical protein